jgi:cytochrome c-type biogenesis protein CcmH/NrfG
LLRDHRINEAETASNTLVDANPGEPEAYARLGGVRMEKDDPEGAVKACAKAVELAPAK